MTLQRSGGLIQRRWIGSLHSPVSVDFSRASDSDTIYQLTTGTPIAGRAGVAIIRISGPRALTALQLLRTKPKAGALPPAAPTPRVATLCRLYAPPKPLDSAASGSAGAGAGGQLLDSSVLAVNFNAPNSFTGQDVVELHVHGTPIVVRGVLNALSSIDGLRAAGAGEFTRRAFTHGKIDLTQVEALADLINGRCNAAKRCECTDSCGVVFVVSVLQPTLNCSAIRRWLK